MKNVLDKAGLTYFWGKIKGMFALKTEFDELDAVVNGGTTETTATTTWTSEIGISGVTGDEFSMNRYYGASDFIQIPNGVESIRLLTLVIKPGSSFNNSVGLAFYDSEQTFISGITREEYDHGGTSVAGMTERTYNVPEGARFLRTTCMTSQQSNWYCYLKSSTGGGLVESIEGLEENVASLESGKAPAVHTHPHTSITDWASATAAFLTTTTAAAIYLTKTDAAATYATKASVPAKTSDLTNDSGYITTASLSGYATQQEVQDAKLEAITGNVPWFDIAEDLSDYEIVYDYPPDDSVYGGAAVKYNVASMEFLLFDSNNGICYAMWDAFDVYSSSSAYIREDNGVIIPKLYFSYAEGVMYCLDGNDLFPLQRRVENVSELNNDSYFVNTSDVNSIINSRMQVISRSAYNALTPTQQASKIYFIYEDSNSSAS